MVFDYIFLTHLPAFYKDNLYREIGKKCNVLVIFLGKSSSIRNNDFYEINQSNYKSIFLSSKNFESRNKIFTTIKLFFLLISTNFKKIVVCGWEHPEFWLTVLFNKKNKNCFVLESSIYESSVRTLKRFFKKIFISRISIAFFSGSPHEKLLKKLDFGGKAVKTLGVGILNKCIPDMSIPKHTNKVKNFLYVGRLSKEKNIELLLKAFKLKPELNLKIIGDGPLKDKLFKLKSSNVNFLGYLSNADIGKHFVDSDVFILPSNMEPWGLVIEEAIYFNTPIICSDKVGSAFDLVNKPKTGIVFKSKSVDSLLKSIDNILIINNYNTFSQNVFDYDIDKKDQNQILCYTKQIL
jgi:glycosyltransferase involved in cell wall biosynthesis